MPWWADPGITRKPRRNPNRRSGFPTTGWFVQNLNGEVLLQSHRGQTWPLRFVQLCQGTWGAIDNSEGTTKLPRIREYAANGDVTVAGDKVMIERLDGDPQRVIVRGGVRGLEASDFLPYNQDRAGANQNRLAGRLAPLDGDGQATGYVDWELAADDKASVVLTVVDAANAPADGPPSGGTKITITSGQVRLELDDGTFVNLSNGVIELGKGAVPPIDPFIISTSYLAAVAAAALELSVLLQTPGPVVGAPGLTPNTALLATQITTSLAAGAPYLSTVLKGS